MIIKFESSFLIKNFIPLANILNNDVQKSYPITKDNDNRFDLQKDEVMFYKIYKSKFHRSYKKMYNKRYQPLQEKEILRTNKTELDLVDCDIMISNKYVHLLFSQGMESINVKSIVEVLVDPKNITIYTQDKHYQLYLNSVTLVMQFVFIVDVLKNIKVDDSFVGKNINIAINNNLKPQSEIVS